MTIRNQAAIVGIGETPTDRLGSKPGEPRKSTAHPQPFWPEEVAEILGITPGFLLGGATGGAGAVSLLGGMAAAINSGIIDLALVIGAAAPFSEHFGGGIQPGD